MGDPRDVLRGDRWKLQRVRSLSALPTDADLLASLKGECISRLTFSTHLKAYLMLIPEQIVDQPEGGHIM